jgi:hypothetical protein
VKIPYLRQNIRGVEVNKTKGNYLPGIPPGGFCHLHTVRIGSQQAGGKIHPLGHFHQVAKEIGIVLLEVNVNVHDASGLGWEPGTYFERECSGGRPA